MIEKPEKISSIYWDKKGLTVLDLIKQLQEKYPPDTLVLLATDEEENGVATHIAIKDYGTEIVLLPLNPHGD